MRLYLSIIAIALLVATCGDTKTTGSAGAPPVASAAAAGGAIESQASFLARCTREMIASNPQSSTWADSSCQQTWETVAAADPMAEAILAAIPVKAAAVDVTTLPPRLPMIQWAARPEGTLAASGRLGSAIDVQVERSLPKLNFYWQKTGELIPYDVVAALRGRGVEVVLVGCQMLGVGEAQKAYLVSAPGHAPFGLGIYDRNAPTANANSFYNVGVDLSGQVSTLALLQRDGGDWTATCPM